ncbi:MAG: hypothetical protein M3P84_05650 [Chloroflexota bacterium]|nr:hypothetical protein [Chloroflexota bacterium]
MSIEGPVLRRALLLIAFVPALVACTAASGPSPSGSPPGGRPTTEASPPFATVPPSAAPVVGEVPAEVMARATADLTRRTQLGPATFTVVRAEQALWADGSLGCAKPGQVYIQVQTPGYWIVLQANGKTYDFRATEAGDLQLCEGLQPQPPSG